MTYELFDDVDWDDPDAEPSIPDASEANLETVSRMLAAMRRLTNRIAEYEILHQNELARLSEQKERVVGPTRRRLDWLRSTVEQYAVRSFLDFDKTKIGTPNGTISSNQTKPVLTVDDERAGNYWEDLDPDLVSWKPKVDVKKLRAKLDRMIADGELEQVIVSTSGEHVVIPAGAAWRKPFGQFESGQFWRPPVVDTETGEVAPGGEYLPGVTWAPSGTDGCGRNIHIVLS